MPGKKSFSYQLLKNFLISTLVPFMLVTSVIAHIYYREYNKDVQLLLNSTINSLTTNISTYLNELQQVTLQPYYNDELYDYLRKLSQNYPYDILDKIPLQRNLDSNMSFVRYTREEINGIFIVHDSCCLYYTVTGTDNKTMVPSFDYAKEEWYQRALKADGRCLILGPHIPNYFTPSDSTVISLVRSIVVLETREPLYVFKIDIDTSIFDRIFKDFSFHVDSKIIIRDEKQQIIYANVPLAEEDQGILRGNPQTGGSIFLKDGAYTAYTYPIKDYPWDITILLSDTQLHSKISVIYLTAILLYLIGVATAIISHTFASKKMVTSIDTMKQILLAIQNEDFSQKYTYVSNTELDELGDSLNDMGTQLETRIQNEYIMTIHQKEIEFRALQAQIQPHFLFNTLNNFIALNQIGDRDSLENALYELSGMLRYILKAPELIPFSMEINFIRDYCSLQKLRFSNRLTYEIVSEADLNEIMVNCPAGTCDGLLIPKLLLQPIVENSILHGIEPCTHPCHISLSVKDSGHGLLITVTDNGVGWDMVEMKGKHIGLNNVKERLMSFSPKSGFYMESCPGKGTRTTIDLYVEE